MEINEMLNVYLFEAESLLDELDEILINSEKQKVFDTESINTIFRIMHTIKGSSAMMEFDSIATIAHKVEDLFAFVRENGIETKFNSELFELMFRSEDFLKEEIEKVKSGTPLSNDIGNFEAKIINFLKKISSEDFNITNIKSSDDSTCDNSDYSYSVKIYFDEDAQMEHIRAFMIVNAISDVVSEFEYNPKNLESDECDELISQEGFNVYFKKQDELNSSIKLIEHYAFVKKFEFDNENGSLPSVIKQKAEIAEKKEDSPVINQIHNNAQSTTSLINVNLLKLDKLMDLMGEIVIAESFVDSIPTSEGVNMEKFKKATRQLKKLTDELQENVMSMRLVTINSVFQKMNRIVRDMSKKLGKDVELVLEGEDTEVDKTIIDNIGDPLMHLVRNAMDHGIESNQERIKNGKTDKGMIKLTATNTSSEVLVTITDNGRGFDKEAILRKAKERGLLKKPEKDYSAREIYSFLLMPGFSTKEQVTEFSGRGVGLDVVKQNIEKIGGKISLESEFGFGSKVVLKIPLTLSIIDGMAVSVGESIFTIPIINIKQSLKVDKHSLILDTENNEMVVIREKCYPLIRLHKIYDVETSVVDIDSGIVILVESGEESYCIFADTLIGEQQVVIKPIPSYLGQFDVKDQGLSGCAILGDGNITLILDAINLYKNI